MIWSMVFIENGAAIIRPCPYGWCLAKMVRGGHIMPTAGYANDYAQCKQDRAPTG
jgi:hypothetical protein